MMDLKFQVSQSTPGDKKSPWKESQMDCSSLLRSMVTLSKHMIVYIKDTLSMSLLVMNYWKEPNAASLLQSLKKNSLRALLILLRTQLVEPSALVLRLMSI